MPKLRQFQAIGDARTWCVLGLDAGGALWLGRRIAETPHRVTMHSLPIVDNGGDKTGAPKLPFGPIRSPRGH
jgi:hypothetical protein